MDTLYTGKIPKTYKYIYLKDNYIYLFDVPQIDNDTLNCYKIDNKGQFLYCYDTFTSNSLINFQEVTVTDKHYYRTDFPSVLFCSLCIALVFIFILNCITSIYRRGGVLGGLL